MFIVYLYWTQFKQNHKLIKILKIPKDLEDQRLDKYLKREFSNLNQSFIEKNLRKKNILVNNQKIKYAQTRTLQPVNRDYLFQRITEFTMPYVSTIGNDFSEKLIDYIMDNRKFVEREYIKSIQIKRVFAARKNL